MRSKNGIYDKLIRRRAGFAAFLSVATLACGSSYSTGPQDNPYTLAAGSYTLVSLNGRALPATVFQDATVRIDITSATLVMRADRTFTETLDGQIFQGTAQPQPEHQVHNGTYTLTGTTAAFSVVAAGGFPAFSFSGTLSGTVLTYTDENATYRYEKR
jgi:hypothetical protein